MLAWRFPNRTAAWSGWTAPKGHENDNLGNYYCVRFADAWEAATRAAAALPELEKRTRRFVEAMRRSSLPGALRDAAVANLSTLVTQTAFRTADGEFHGFEGCDDQHGCCFGNCTHVWNYETSTQFLFPSVARSLRKASFGFSQDDQGGMRFRQMLPDGIDRFGYAAADGQMGQIIKTYLDWKLCGDTEMAARSMAATSRKVSRSRGFPAGGTPIATVSWKASSTTPTTSSSTVRILSGRSTTWAPCAPPRRWRARSVTTPRRPTITRCF